MTEEETLKAKDIFSRPSKEWTNAENSFLYVLMKKCGRDTVKNLRNAEVVAAGLGLQ